jgi:hypothetical protein
MRLVGIYGVLRTRSMSLFSQELHHLYHDIVLSSVIDQESSP